MAKEQFTIEEKLDILKQARENEWSDGRTGKEWNVGRTTILGWRKQLQHLEAAPTRSSKRVKTPGPPRPTLQYEPQVVNMIKLRYDIGDSVSRSEIIAFCCKVIPKFSSKSPQAASSWLTRFIAHYNLGDFVLGLHNGANSSSSPVSSFDEKPHSRASSVSSMDETPRLPASPVPSFEENPRCATSPVCSVSSLPEKPRSRASSVSSMDETPRLPASPVPSFDEKPRSSATLLVCSVPSLAEKPRSLPSQETIQMTTAVEKAQVSVTEVSTMAENPHLPAPVPSRQLSGRPHRINDDYVAETQVDCFTDGSKRRLVVEKVDVERLEPGVWLNDTLLTYYIHEMIPIYDGSGIYNFDCQFFPLLDSAYGDRKSTRADAYETCSGYTRIFPWETYRYVLIPVNQALHWSFLVVQNPMGLCDGLSSCIVHVDSLAMGHRPGAVASTVKAFMEDEQKVKWPLRKPVKCPVKSCVSSPSQRGGDNCGVFVLFYMKRNEALLRSGLIYLLYEIQKICTAPRGGFVPAKFRVQFKDSLLDRNAAMDCN